VVTFSVIQRQKSNLGNRLGKIRITDNKVMVIVPYVSFTIDGENRYIELMYFCDKNQYIFVRVKTFDILSPIQL
jgi:hypothetical protein